MTLVNGILFTSRTTSVNKADTDSKADMLEYTYQKKKDRK